MLIWAWELQFERDYLLTYKVRSIIKIEILQLIVIANPEHIDNRYKHIIARNS